MHGVISPLSQYVFTAWCLVQHRDNFTFTFYNSEIGLCVEAAVQENVKIAVEENKNECDLAVSVDDFWQKRGHTFLHGVVTATETGDVIDI
jgi:hypothetical protein